MRTWILCFCFGLTSLACGATTPPDSKTPTSASTPAGSDPSPSSPASPGKKSEFHADVAGVRDATEGVPYKSVKMLFSNPSANACEVSSYELEWPGGKKLVNNDRSSQFKKFIVPAGATRQRSLRVHPSDGDITTLDASSAKLHAECN